MRPLFKIATVGECGVGKTSAIVRFAENIWLDDPTITVGVDFRIKTMELDGDEIRVQLWDIAGKEKFLCLTKAYFRNSQAVLIFFDITRRDSFMNLDQFKLKTVVDDQNCLFYLIGTKIDLSNNRNVTVNEAKSYANEIGAKYFEISAKTGENVQSTFEAIVDDAYYNSNTSSPPPPKINEKTSISKCNI